MIESRWEHGSDFHLSLEAGELVAPWRDRPHRLYGSGRDAMRGLLSWGRDTKGWKRILVPTFFCQDVVAALARELVVALYEDAPDAPVPARVEANADDAVLVVDYYGMRRSLALDTRGVTIEDFTHDPVGTAAAASRASYAVASLRKTLPLPDGGVVWSPGDQGLPAEAALSADHACAAFDRLSAMVLKSHYLEGHAVDKDAFRARAIAGERAIGGGTISGMSPFSAVRLPTMPAAAWRARRADNLAAFRAALGEVPRARVLDAPFAATLLFDTPELREHVRAALVHARIYPAVLWSLDEPVVAGIPERHVDLAQRVLSLHCDFRYGADDMRKVAELVQRAIGA